MLFERFSAARRATLNREFLQNRTASDADFSPKHSVPEYVTQVLHDLTHFLSDAVSPAQLQRVVARIIAAAFANAGIMQGKNGSTTKQWATQASKQCP